MWLPCPYLKADAELTDERFAHIARVHPELLPGRLDLVASTLLEPDEVRRDLRYASTRLLSRWYNDLLGGKHVVVAVVGEPPARCWVVTTYVADRITQGRTEWTRS